MLDGWTDRDAVTVRDARYRPNVLNLLADIGLGPADDLRIARANADFEKHVAEDGRFLVPERGGGWVADWCDHCAVTNTRQNLRARADPAAVDLIVSEFTVTEEGRGWGDPADDGSVSFRPDETTLALRVLSQVSPGSRPRRIRDAVRSLLVVAMRRVEDDDFVVLAWPPFGFNALSVLDVVGRYRDVWDGPRAGQIDRRHLVALVASHVNANFDDRGVIVVRRPSRGFATLPMARRGLPSALATAVVCVALRRFEPVVDEVIEARSQTPSVLAAAG
jgi:hypothetical protein